MEGRHYVTLARVEARQDVSAALRRLPGEWRHGLARRWRPGLAVVLAAGLDHGLGVAAAAAAVGLYADLDQSAGRHVPAARAGLSRLLADVRLGLACPDCGEQLPPSERTRGGMGARCGCQRRLPLERDPQGWAHGPTPAPDGGTGEGVGRDVLPVAARAASWRALRVDPDVVAASDPEAAAVLRETILGLG